MLAAASRSMSFQFKTSIQRDCCRVLSCRSESCWHCAIAGRKGRRKPKRKKSDNRMNNFDDQILREITRRHFFRDCKVGLGSLALASLMGNRQATAAPLAEPNASPFAPRQGHFPAKAKNVIFL